MSAVAERSVFPHGNARGSMASMSEAERKTRIELAAAFRVAYHLGWNNTANNHIAARVPDEPNTFLMNPMGLGWHEIRASDFIKSDFDGNYLTETDMKLAPAGYNFHSCILRMMEHINCTLHVHAPGIVHVSALEEGLMYFDQGSCALHGELNYHDFEGLAQEEDEGPRIVRDLGEGHVLLMRNHGGLTVGRTIAEAFCYMRRLVDACEVQSRVLSMNATPRQVPQEIVEFTKSQMSARHPGKPYGEREWPMYFRLAGQLDPNFRS